jgi:L-tartrate/succinate antiporter
MLYPIIRNIPKLYDSEPGPSARKIGSYLMWTAFAATCVTGSMFMTGLAPNLLAVTLVSTTLDITITWSDWFFGFLPAGIVIFALVPLAAYWIYPPSVKKSQEVPAWAAREIRAMGAIRREEVMMALLALTALVLWILGGDIVHPTTAALVVLCMMIFSGIVTWDDVLGHKQAWNVLAWFATLVAMADGLRRVGFLEWFAAGAADSLKGAPGFLLVPLIVAAFYLIHYLFASLTAHVTALLPVFLTAAVSVQGVPPEQLALMLCYCIGIMGVLTPYATGPAPVYYACGFINRREFWVLGFWFGMAFLVIYLAICSPYLGVL